MPAPESTPRPVSQPGTVTYDRQFGRIGRVPLTLLFGVPTVALVGGAEYLAEGTAWPVVIVLGAATLTTTCFNRTSLNDPVTVRAQLPNVPVLPQPEATHYTVSPTDAQMHLVPTAAAVNVTEGLE
jgi:hypothetical protein